MLYLRMYRTVNGLWNVSISVPETAQNSVFNRYSVGSEVERGNIDMYFFFYVLFVVFFVLYWSVAVVVVGLSLGIHMLCNSEFSLMKLHT